MAPDRLVGSVLGERYELIERAGRGGTAVVYRAIDQRLGRTVAVKIIHDALVGDADYTKRFDREARAAAALSHPNIVAIFDRGHTGERPYIVMEFIRGQSLRSVIAQQAPLPPLVALHYLDAIARALAAAHEAGLIHRDIKPENVLITGTGEVKVTDFGLAKATTSQTSATHSVLMGTLSYLAPELMTTGVATAASDIYSTGIVLYEMLTGQKPHTGDEAANVLYKHVNVDVPAPTDTLTGAARSRIPDYLDALVVAATSRNPALRPPNGRALEQDITRVRQRLSQGVRSDPALALALRSRGRVGDAETTAVVRPAETITAPVPAPTSLPAPYRGEEATPTLDTARPLQPARPLVTIKTEPKYVRRRRGLVALALLIVLGLLGFGGAFWWVKVGRWTTQPPINGLTQEQAFAALTEAGLTGNRHEEYSEDIPLGVVIRSQPGDGERILKEGTVVELYVSLGQERYLMPSLAGLTQEEATAQILANHLALGEVATDWSEEVEVGRVIATSQEPEASLKAGTVINLTLSRGPQPIPIPDLTGQDLESARATLEGLTFTVNATEEHSREVAAGHIISQAPASGEGHRGDPIALVVSKGPVMVYVPEVIDLKRDDALVLLRQTGLNAEVQASGPFGFLLNRAVGTNPGAGALVAEGSTVVLYVS